MHDRANDSGEGAETARRVRDLLAVEPPRVATLERPAAAGLGGWLARHGVRLDPGRRAAATVGVVAVVVAAVAGWWLLHGRPHASRLGPPAALATPTGGGVQGASGVAASSGVTASSGAAASPTFGPKTSTAALVVVDVAGKVRHPGVYRLPSGSRVDDALRAAGGALPGVDVTPLNLAAPLTDGQQVAVGVPGAMPSAVPPSGTAGATGADPASGGQPVNLNTAGEQELEGLPGVGPVLAQHILDWRAAHGRFGSVDQLQDVTGIGPTKFAQLRPLVTV